MSAKIACVIPSYNHAKYVLDAVESVLRQGLAPDQLIIVDDGSSDGTAAAVRTFGEDSPLDIQIVGRNLNANRAFAESLINKLKFVPGAGRLSFPPLRRSCR